VEFRAIEFPDVVLVTGAAGAVGSALCEALVAHDVQVIATDREQPSAPLAPGNNGISWLTADLEKVEDRAQLVEGVRARASRSLGIVHNASFVGASELEGWNGPLISQSSETWNRALEVSLTAAFSITRDLSDLLSNNPGSAIVHVSSIYSSLAPDWSLYRGTDLGNPAAYGVAKAGVEQLTRWLATSLAPHARVNAVAPGGLKRGQPQSFVERYETKVPLGRMGTETDVVDSILYLLSSYSSYVTGQVLVVDGGFGLS
jgi:NAD(P)-dependent dehydrogenase (short-subunit alcohol dehydrogenase family)